MRAVQPAGYPDPARRDGRIEPSPTTAPTADGQAPPALAAAPVRGAGSLIPPYGGRLVDRRLSGSARAEAIARSPGLAVLRLTEAQAAELQLIGCGAYSPLTGFMGREDYRTVRDDMHLACGLPWTLPVVLRVDERAARPLKPPQVVALEAPSASGGLLAGFLEAQDVYRVDLEQEARKVFGTASDRHPGVRRLLASPDWCVGGPVWVLEPPASGWLRTLALTPAETRQRFAARGWRQVAAFQTRNPGHRAHEYLQKCVLEWVDGLLVHPLVGPTKEDDLPAEVRLRAYEILLEHYFPLERVLLAALPAPMRYAGPREAVFHALVRRNYGCSHFVVGRDHAGVGDFYRPFDAHRLFDRFDPAVLGITPVRFDSAFYCRRCGQMATGRTCPHPRADHLSLSGSEMRRILASGGRLPPEFTRPEVADWLSAAAG